MGATSKTRPAVGSGTPGRVTLKWILSVLPHMPGSETVTLTVATLLGAQLVVLAFAYRHSRAMTAAGESAIEGAADAGDGMVSCPECGTENERGYRYCRNCVAELPARTSFEGWSASPVSRGML